ncbi:MAG: amidohydrolase family protein [Gammaproteobacteria bacterium]|nr:amidohydrolase family protein [Gammaproteobacteria bacterium]
MTTKLPSLALTILLLTFTAAHAVEPPPARDMAFVNARVLTMAEPGVLDSHTVIVRDGRIHAIGPSTELAPGANDVVIEAAGRILMPGLAEMHAHVPAPQGPNQPQGYTEDVLLLWVANGVTLARGMLGHSLHLELRERLDQHAVLGPRLITSGPSFSGQSVNAVDEARRRVAAQAEAGYDFLKIHRGLTREQYDAIVDAAAEAGIALAGHVPVDVGLARALEAGQETVDHLDGYIHALVADPDADPDAARSFFGIGLVPHVQRDAMASVAAETRASGAAIVPTETLFENFQAAAEDIDGLVERPENVYLPPALKDAYLERLQDAGAMAELVAEFLDLRKELLGALHRAGVPILLGSDSPQIMNVPGFAIHRELEAMVAAGLSPFAALESGTTAPARYFGAEGRYGSIVPGAEADLILLRDDPLEDIGNTRSIDGVMVRGRWLDRAFLDAELTRIRERYAAL